MSIDVAAALCAAASDLGLTPFVRTPEREYGMIGRLLDGGTQGIVAARIETADQARTIARACRFPPRGQRSQLSAVPLSGMQPVPASVLNPRLDAATIVQIVLETPEGIAAADAIAAVDGVDMIAVGTNDLTSELGIPGQHDHPLVRAAVETAAQACRRHGRLLMLAGISDRALHASLSELGVRPLYLTGMDTDLLYHAARARVDSLTRTQEAHRQ